MSGNKRKNLIDIAVLVVEDNEVNQKVTAAMLQHFSITPDIAANGQEALNLAAQKSYDLIFMDCQMPIKNGFDTTRQLRRLGDAAGQKFKTPGDVIIIAMTANVAPDDIQACKECGMDDFIAKPVELEVITKKLVKWFEA